jgi:His/Glu/Gln/Arg/opine family amino acid ABC transporter permease subunit
MIREFSIDEFIFLLLAARWTVLLSIIALLGGGLVGLAVALARVARGWAWRAAARAYIRIFQGTPLLMQLFLLYFGTNIFGLQMDAWTSALLQRISWRNLARLHRGDSVRPVGRRARVGVVPTPAAALDHSSAGTSHRASTNGRLRGSGHQEHIAHVGHRFRRADARGADRQQRDVSAVAGLYVGRRDLFCAMLAALLLQSTS